MPVRYSENDLVLRQLKGKLLGKIRQLQEARTEDIVRVKQLETAIKVKELEDVRIQKL